MNVPYYWIGVVRTDEGFILRFYDLVKNQSTDEPLSGPQVYLRASGDYNRELATPNFTDVKHLVVGCDCVWVAWHFQIEKASVALLNVLQRSGIGVRRSTGNGKFEVLG